MEVEVRELKTAFEEHKKETKEDLSEVNRKLDDLLVLRNKGAGVFWLVSLLFGAGIVSFAAQVWQWLKG